LRYTTPLPLLNTIKYLLLNTWRHILFFVKARCSMWYQQDGLHGGLPCRCHTWQNDSRRTPHWTKRWIAQKKKNEDILEIPMYFYASLSSYIYCPLPKWVNMQEWWVNITGIYTLRNFTNFKYIHFWKNAHKSTVSADSITIFQRAKF
jgi:hypothetical protein